MRSWNVSLGFSLTDSTLKQRNVFITSVGSKLSLLYTNCVVTTTWSTVVTYCSRVSFKVLVDRFCPEEVETQDYDNLKQVLHRYYAKNICITTERVSFSHRHRKESETVTQAINVLRSLAGNCDFGGSLAERLRDQLIIGIGNDAWQKEIFRLHPTNVATLAQAESTALILEQASMQQQRLQGLIKSGAAAQDTTRRVTKTSTSTAAQHYQYN